MIDKLNITHPELIEKSETLITYKGYDDIKLYENLWNKYKIKPLIDI